MTDELRFERTDERISRRADDVATTPDADETAQEQVGVGTAPGQPPTSGTGERSHRVTTPPAGRVDAERATSGTSDALPGSVPEGAPPANEGGAMGDRPEDAVADVSTDDVAGEPGIEERGERRTAGRSNLRPG